MRMKRKEKFECFLFIMVLMSLVLYDIYTYERGFFYLKKEQDRIVEGALINTTIEEEHMRSYDYYSIVRFYNKNNWMEAKVPRSINDHKYKKIKVIITSDGKYMREGWIWGRHNFEFWACLIALIFFLFCIAWAVIEKIYRWWEKRYYI